MSAVRAAFPFVIGTKRRSLEFLRRNRLACRIFSVVTILSQAWFMGWAASRMALPVAAASCGAVALLLLAGRSSRTWQGIAAVMWVGTIAVFAFYLQASPNAGLARVLADELTWHPHALYALPLVLSGFLLSPYLDLTFHHALLASRDGQAARWSFGVFFPMLFGTMLLFSLAIRDDLARTLLRSPPGPAPAWMQWVLAALILQCGFSLLLHARHLPGRPPGVLCAAALAAGLAANQLGDVRVPTGQGLGEFVYRCTIGFYGVLTPCWVWAAAFSRGTPAPGAYVLAGAALLLAAIPMLLSRDWLPLYAVALGLIAATRLTGRRALVEQ